MKNYAVILANDHIESRDVLRVTDQVRDNGIDGIKLGITSTMSPGVGVIEEVKKLVGDGVSIIADYKVADIGFKNKEGHWQGTNSKIVGTLSDAGADYIICHTIVGTSSIHESVETAHAHGSKVLTLPFMTHQGAELFFGMPLDSTQVEHVLGVLANQYGAEVPLQILDNSPQLRTITDIILALGGVFGVDGYIGPGNNPDVLKRYREFTDELLCCPGFGRQDKLGRSLEEQISAWAHIVGPRSGMIVGSLIYKAEDPGKVTREIVEIRDRIAREITDSL